MRTTIALDDQLLEEASELTGQKSRTALLHLALETLVRVEAGRRLAALGGTDPAAVAAPRERQGQ